MIDLKEGTVVFFVVDTDPESWVFEPTILQGTVVQVYGDGDMRVKWEENNIHWDWSTLGQDQVYLSASDAAEAFLSKERRCLEQQVQAFA